MIKINEIIVGKIMLLLQKKIFLLAVILLQKAVIADDRVYHQNKHEDVQESTWKTNDTELSLEVLREQSKNEVTILFNTIFPSHAKNIELSKKEKDSETKIRNFLKRFFISLAWLKFTPEKNGDDLKDWKFSLASSLSRGGRILIETRDGVSIKDVMRVLSFGDKHDKKSTPLYSLRAMASHGIGKKQGRIIEESLKGVKGIGKNLINSVSGNHLYINLALGGLGSPQIDGALVGPGGISLNPKTHKPIKNRQHGHMYINLNTTLNAMLIGIEGSEPGTQNMFGHNHGMDGAFKNSSSQPTITGGYKWPVIRDTLEMSVPSEYGGKRLVITPEILEMIENCSRKILAMDTKEQKTFFKRILSQKSLNAQEKISKLLIEEREENDE